MSRAWQDGQGEGVGLGPDSGTDGYYAVGIGVFDTLNASLRQTVLLQPGSTNTLSFDMGTSSHLGAGVKSIIQVEAKLANGSVLGSQLYTNVSTAFFGAGRDGFKPHTFSFAVPNQGWTPVAISLEFSDRTPNYARSIDALLDNVRLKSSHGRLWNINFGEAQLSGLDQTKIGLAATGLSTNDQWNFYSQAEGDLAHYRNAGSLTNLVDSEGTATLVDLSVNNAGGVLGLLLSDYKYNTYLFPLSPGNLSVTLSAPFTNGVLRYTLDGSAPTATSPLYAGAILLTNSVTLKARAFVEGTPAGELETASFARIYVEDTLISGTDPLSADSKVTHDLARDFSLTNDAGATWSYGWKTDPTGAFTLFDQLNYGPMQNGVTIP